MLQIQDLKVSIEGKEILKGVCLEVKPGEIHAVMGPNGSGKSTLAYTVAGHPSYEVVAPSTNNQIPSSKQISNKAGVYLDGQDVLQMSPDERAQSGLFLAFQYPVEVAGVKVDKFLYLAHKARFGDSSVTKFPSLLSFRDHLLDLAEELEVNVELLKRGLNEGFSGGEKKRLEVLQMAVLEPKYAVLDETDSGLDIDAIKAVSKGVNKIIKKYNTGVLLITHYQRILKYLKPDHVHVMIGGKIAESGGEEVVERLEKVGYGLDRISP